MVLSGARSTAHLSRRKSITDGLSEKRGFTENAPVGVHRTLQSLSRQEVPIPLCGCSVRIGEWCSATQVQKFVSTNPGILLVILFPRDTATVTALDSSDFWVFKAGMWGTPISALLNSPTVPHEPGLSTAYEISGAIFSRILHEFEAHHDL
jgi:hypothetical protein